MLKVQCKIWPPVNCWCHKVGYRTELPHRDSESGVDETQQAGKEEGHSWPAWKRSQIIFLSDFLPRAES